MSDWFGKEIFKLGFGLMRLPKNADGSIDVAQTSQMVDRFLAAGGTYFDTAYIYDYGKSEQATKLALVDRHPRDKFTLCTKLNAAVAEGEAEAKRQFYTSLERTGAGWFDYYLLHSLQRNNIQKYDDFKIWDFVKTRRDEGLIKHWGFSFHADPEFLDQLLTKHPDAEFVQLQINYADWENPGVQARACYEVARKHGKSIVVMEPVKGGTLAKPHPAVQEVLKAADPNASCASWAIRYAASMEGIMTVLSGMSDLAQMDDNLSYMKNFKPLNSAEQETIKKAQKALEKDKSIPCTACHYCTEGCPAQIPIPDIFAVKNDEVKSPSWDHGQGRYAIATQGKGKASACVECGSCEGACPQHLEIIKLLKDCAGMEG